MQELLQEILKGESKTLEFKERMPSNSSIVKTIIAFSNTSGGKLILGVSDERNIVGITDDIFELQDKISSIIYESCYPAILPHMYTKNIEGKILLVIDVSKGSLVPYYIKSEEKENGVYIRIGATNRKADRENILELERQRSNISFDEEINYEFDFLSLNIDSLKNRLKEAGKDLTTEKMLSLKLIKESNKTFYPTNGLLILLGLLENTTTKCSRFKGTNMNVFLDKKEYSGDLFSQLENIEGFIKNHINLKGEIKGLQRTDIYEIPEVAIREAVVNALVHRNYSNLGRDIKIGVYDDRLEIVSPGGLPNGLTNEDIYTGKSEIRNRVVARVFKELNYIEQWGSGINRIKSLCIDHGLKEPFIEESGDFIGVRIFRNNKVAESTGKILESTGKILENAENKIMTNQEEVIYKYLLSNGSIKKLNVEGILNVKDSRARKILEEMTNKDYIIKQGQGRSTYYVLKNKE